MVVILHNFKNDSFTLLLNIHRNIPHTSHNKTNKYTMLKLYCDTQSIRTLTGFNLP